MRCPTLYFACNDSIDGTAMAALTVRNLDDELKARLRLRAAAHGRSMEEEVRSILREALNEPDREGLGTRISRRFGAANGAELALPARDQASRAADLDD